MKQINDYKNRFNILLESKLGDVRPLVNEQIKYREAKDRTIKVGPSYCLGDNTSTKDGTKKNNSEITLKDIESDPKGYGSGLYRYLFDSNDKYSKDYADARSKIVNELLGDDEQKKLWNEIMTNKPCLAAIVISKIGNPVSDDYRWVKQIFISKKTSASQTPGSTTPQNTTEQAPKEFPEYSIQTGEGEATNDFFDNNSFELKPSAQNKIETNFLQPFRKIEEEIKKSTGSKTVKKCISYITVQTSASRLRNMIGTQLGPSFLELSKNRSNAMYTYIFNKLKSEGYTEWCNGERILLDFKGTNGDGTSGPNPPSGYAFVKKGGIEMSEVGTTDEQRNEFGKPLNSLKDYEQYKYNRVNVGVAFNPVPEGEKNPEEKPQQSTTDPQLTQLTGYEVIFSGRMKAKLNIDWSFLKNIGGNSGYGPKVSHGVAACPKW